MKFAIITHAVHKKQKDKYFAYEPYMREMNLWAKNVDEIIIIAPKSFNLINSIETSYNHKEIKFTDIPSFDITSINNSVKSLFVIPIILWKVWKVMKKADHIHLRCPGNVGFLGCIIQIFFPSKPKTVKYAGNWDPKSKQPLSYRIQKWIISNTFLTKNCKVLVYGKWKNQSKNIVPFFTASYTQNDIENFAIKDFSNNINFIYVGTFSKGKQPLLSVKVVETLKKQGYNVILEMYGDGVEFKKTQEYIIKNNLEEIVVLHGNQPKEVVKEAYKKAHFLIFLSKSEGWPKVVAEAMFWSCLPISTPISCVPFMLDYGNRGILVNNSIDESITKIKELICNHKLYQTKVLEAKKWSQQYTLEKFSKEVAKFL